MLLTVNEMLQRKDWLRQRTSLLTILKLLPIVLAFNPASDAMTATGVTIFNNMPEGKIKDKLEKISEQFAYGELKT